MFTLARSDPGLDRYCDFFDKHYMGRVANRKQHDWNLESARIFSAFCAVSVVGYYLLLQFGFSATFGVLPPYDVTCRLRPPVTQSQTAKGKDM